MPGVWSNTGEELKYLIELREKNPGTTLTDLAVNLTSKFNKRFTRDTIDSKLRREGISKKAIGSGESGEPSYKDTVEIKSDGSHYSDKLIKMSKTQCKDANYLLQAHGYDKDSWELVSAKSNIWNAYSKIDKQMTLYASKITVKPRKDDLTLDSVRQAFEEIAAGYIRPLYVPTRYSDTGKLLEVSIADLHLGKLAWYGDANDTYNVHIARERYFHIINDVLTRTRGQDFEKILFLWSHDFFNFDNTQGSTTAGTPQNNDLKWAQMYQIGTKMLTEGIDLLSQQSKVETMYVGANHDKQTSFYATEHLAAWFRNDPNVKVDTDPRIRKTVEFGKCLVEFTHGHAEGKRIGETMPVEAKEAWGRTDFHETHCGHWHQERTVTKSNGVIVRYLGSPSGTDTWHYESAYVGSIKKGQSFIWDKDKGLMGVIYTAV